MKIQATWIVNLPLKIATGNQFKKLNLNNLSFSIRDVEIQLLINICTNIVDRVEIKLEEEFKEAYLLSPENTNYLSEFYKNIINRAGTAIQSFLDGFSKYTNDEYYPIFNGKDFTTVFGFETTPPIMVSSRNESNRHLYLEDDKLNYTVKFATKNKNTIDAKWYLRVAEHSFEQEKYEISLITMASMFDLLVSSHLAKFFDDKGDFAKVNQGNVNNPSFVQRYFKYGLTLITSKELNIDTLDAVDFIYKVEDKLVHGKNLYDIQLIKERGINEYNIRDTWQALIYYSNEVYDYFYNI